MISNKSINLTIIKSVSFCLSRAASYLNRYKEKMSKIISAILITIFLASSVYAGEPQRDKGISAYALPKRVADISGKPWGLEISYAPYLKPEPGIPFLQSIQDVVKFIKKQDSSVIENGFWVVTTNPDAYSKAETAFYDQLKIELSKKNIPLFWSRASDLKNGFKRY